MSGTDKMKNRVESVRGKAKQVAGRVTGSTRSEERGRRKQAKADLKDAGEKAKDAFKH